MLQQFPARTKETAMSLTGPSRRFCPLAHVRCWSMRTYASGRTQSRRHASLDHLVGGRQQRFGDGKAERLGGLEVDDQINFGNLLHGEVGRLIAFENASGIDT